MNRIQLSRALILGAALGLTANSSHAQTMPGEMPDANAAQAIKTVDIKVRNIPVGLVAYWLDPAHQMIPQQLRISRSNSGYWTREIDELPRQAGNGNGPKDLTLPAGIDAVIAIEPSNVLKVRGTEAGIEALKKLVAELDVPINQAEVEAKFCFISPQILKTLPLKFVESEGGGAPSIASMPPTLSLDTELNKLIAANKIRLITAPRVTAIDGLTAQLYSTESRSIMLSPLAKKWGDIPEAERPWQPGLTTVQLRTGFNCTPIFHGDLIKLLMSPTLDNVSANVTANMRDGQTIAISMPVDKSNLDRHLVIFVTTRVIRRAGDEVAQTPQTPVEWKTGPSTAF